MRNPSRELSGAYLERLITLEILITGETGLSRQLQDLKTELAVLKDWLQWGQVAYRVLRWSVLLGVFLWVQMAPDQTAEAIAKALKATATVKSVL